MIQMAMVRLLLLLNFLAFVLVLAGAWAPSIVYHRLSSSRLSPRMSARPSPVALNASPDGKKKRKRRRKQPPSGTVGLPTSSSNVVLPNVDIVSDTIADINNEEVDDDDDDEDDDLSTIAEVANFKFKPDDALGDKRDSDGDAIPLPDIRDTLKRKELEEEMARLSLEQEQQRPKIKRSDREAFVKLLEQQPYADADDSLFEEEKYSVVSAILGEGAKSFLGIPFGPLQVGHFIGALGITLMALVEYPGFPLTNLPTPLRDALQGGLAFVYAINFILAVAAVFKAGERGQPKFLWATKAFFVGGLAFDQLTQLPTISDIDNKTKNQGKPGRKRNK